MGSANRQNIMGELLQELREDKGWSQAYVADLLGIVRSTVSLYELGKSQVPFDIVLKLSEIYNVNIDYLYGKTKIRTSWKDLNMELQTDTGTVELDKMISHLKELSPHGRQIAMEVVESLLLKEKCKPSKPNKK